MRCKAPADLGVRNSLARSPGSGERKGREEVRGVGGGKPECKKKQSGEREEKAEGKGRREGAGGRGSEERDGGGRERGAAGVDRGAGRPERIQAGRPGLPAERPRNSAGSGSLLPRRGAGSGRGEERLFGEPGLNPACTVCACFWEGHRREDGSNDLIFLFFPGTISAQIGRMK